MLPPSMAVAPIGIFDSGLGGISVLKEVIKVIPNYSFVYVSDSGWCPYGVRPTQEVVDRCHKIVHFLIEQGCKLIVVACNTATAAAIDYLRNSFSVSFVGMEPAVKPAALHSKTGVVGILATLGTFKGRLYHETSQRFASHVQVIEQTGDGLVELVEQGLADSPEAMQLLHKYIDPMIQAGADHLVLGCTHYPFLIPSIEKISRGRLVIVDPAPAVAQQVYALLGHPSYNERSPAVYRFYATGSDTVLQALVYSNLSSLHLSNVNFNNLII